MTAFAACAAVRRADYEPALPPAEPKYTFVTYMYVKSSERPLDIVDRIVALLQLPARTPVKVRRARACSRPWRAPSALG